MWAVVTIGTFRAEPEIPHEIGFIQLARTGMADRGCPVLRKELPFPKRVPHETFGTDDGIRSKASESATQGR